MQDSQAEIYHSKDRQENETKKDKWFVNRDVDDPIIYTMILRGLVTRYGLGVPYVESSPYAPYDDVANWPNSGNSHISCWKTALFGTNGHPENWRIHFEKVCSFDSEFCIQGPCNAKAIKTFMSPQNYWPPNDNWIYRIQRGHRNIPHIEQQLTIAGATFGNINSLQEYVKYGQATHLEQTRAEYEGARRDRPNNGGTMSWMFNDCWPTSNWSIIDYYRQDKPAYFAAKRACAALLPIIFERNGHIEFFFSNDTLCTQHTNLIYGQETLGGKTVWSKMVTLDVPENCTVKFDRLLKEDIKIPLGDFLFIDAIVSGKKIPRVIYFSDGWKRIPWPENPEIKFEIIDQKQTGQRWITNVRLTTDRFVRLCHLILKEKYESQALPYDPVLQATYSDNYFDLSSASEKVVEIRTEKKIDKNDLYIGNWWTQWE